MEAELVVGDAGVTGGQVVQTVPVREQVRESDRGLVDEQVGSAPRPVTIDLGYEEQFEHLYARAYGVAYQLLGRRPEAEDVAQETLARCFVHWRKVRDYAEAWVVRVAGNLAIDAWRRNRRIDATVDDVSTATTPTPGPDPQRVDLHRALRQISRRQREVLVLRFLADLPEAEVARALGCSVGSVKQHAARGLAALRTTAGLELEETK
jgi:RNA polymerase sigma-70 factor (sigma-E family)